MKKCILSLLALMLLAFPVCAEEIISGNGTVVNPLYEHLNIEYSQLYNTTKGVTYENCGDYDGALEYLIQQAKTRQPVVNLAFYVDESVIKETSALTEQAVEEKIMALFHEIGNYSEFDKNGAESDYLYYQWYKYPFSYTLNMDKTENGYYLCITYNIIWFTTPEQIAQEDARVQEILDELNVYDEDEYTQIKAVYDYLLDNAAYVSSKKYNEASKTGDHLIYHSSYSALIMGETVCQGYATAIFRLLRELGISCRLISGDAGGPHAWNIVRIGSYYYLIDATWDDQLYNKAQYFLKSSYSDHWADEEFLTTEFKRYFPMASEDYTQTLYFIPNAPENVSATQSGNQTTIKFDLDYTAQYTQISVNGHESDIYVNSMEDKTTHSFKYTSAEALSLYEVSALRAEYNSRTDTENIHENTCAYLYDDVDFSVFGEGVTKITGAVSSVAVTLPAKVSLTGDLTFDNLVLRGESVIYANGHKITITDSVTSDSRLTVYGGSEKADIQGDTYLNLCGGLYINVYGGGNNGKVTGNTTVILGGNANKGDVFTSSPCKVYGGGKNGAVEGKTSVTLKDNAVTLYIVGAGLYENGTCNGTDIQIQGGSVMNVYAGSKNTPLPQGIETNITMTGGKAESLFGGCEKVAMTGHTRIYLLGGYITRRIYTGCYNDADISGKYSTDLYVKGTTALYISPLAEINTKTSISDTETYNTGVFIGSRTKESHSDEINTVVYLDGCYDTHNKYIGEKHTLCKKAYISFENYIIKETVNGNVQVTKNGGEIKLIPDRKYYTLVNGTQVGEKVSLTQKTNTVTFEKLKHFLDVLEETENTIKYEVTADETAYLFTGTFLGDKLKTHTFEEAQNEEKTAEKNKDTTLKIFIWSNALKPLAEPIIR